MAIIDYVFIGGVLLFALIGLGLGFGKQLSLLTRGILGLIISVFVCYLIFGLVYNIPFVQSLLEKFKQVLASSDKPVVSFLLKIRIDIIAYAVALFILVTLARILVVYIIKNVMEIESTPMKIVNKTLGLVLGVAVFFALGIIALQVIFLIYGTEGGVWQAMEGSFFKLDYVYTHNPLTLIQNLWK